MTKRLTDWVERKSLISSLDLNSGYFQIRISDEDAHKTAFVTPFGQYEFKVLGQGLANSPATFQMVMNRMFAPYLQKFVVIYLDDILIFGKDPKEHLANIETVLQVLAENKFYAKLTKCSFNNTEVKFLGHIIGREGVKVNPEKIEVVKTWPEPKSVKQVQQFLGLTNYFRKFIQGYAALAAPLSMLTKVKDKAAFAQTWTLSHTEAFERLKQELVSAPVLALPDFGAPFQVIADASILGTGAVLLQNDHPIAYTSKRYIPAEINYTTTEQEMLAIVRALKEWRCYLEGSEVTLLTDHEPNTYFDTKTYPVPETGQMGRGLSAF